MTTFNRELYTVLYNLERNLKNRPIILGGISGAAGGSGGNPTGFIGQLVQTRVTYDTTEAATAYTPPSGVSLLDNLNHIRYRISTLETNFGLTVEKDNVVVASGITLLDFRGNVNVTAGVSGEVLVEIVPSGAGTVPLYSGVFNENLSSYVNGTETHFTLANTAVTDSLSVYYNGIKQTPTYFVVDGNNGGFTTTFVPASGDNLVVDYMTLQAASAYLTYDHGQLTGLLDDDHDIYHTDARGDSRYYTKTLLDAGQLDNRYYTEGEVDILIGQTLSSGIFQNLGDLLVGTGAGSFNILPAGSDNQVLVVASGSASGVQWESLPSTLQYHQMVFTVAGENLSTTGTQPLRIYAYLPTDGTINEVYAYVATAPTTTALQINVKKGGASFITGGYLTIPVSSNSVSGTSFTNDVIANNDYFQLEIVQGDTGASDLTVHVRYQIGA